MQNIVETLREKHGVVFTTMQYRIWAEMITSGLHTSYDDPSNSTMFKRAGGKEAPRRSDGAADVLQAASQAITSVLTPKLTADGSPGKLIDNQSKCYKQLGELKNLKTSGVLSQEEYEVEKQAVMDILKKLSH